MTTAVSSAVLLLAACSPAEEAPTTTTTEPTAMAAECVPIADDSLVILQDDLGLQNADNIIPAINAETALDPAVGAALDEVSKVLDTPKLVELNRRTDVDFETNADVAADFVASEGIAAPFESGGKLTVGAAGFSESITLAEIYAIVLRDAGFDVDIVTVSNREIYMPSLISGEIDVVPEYAATAAEFLNGLANGADAPPVASSDIDETYAALSALGNDAGVIFSLAASAQDKNAFATTQAFADEWGIATLSEFADACGPISLGGPAECPERPFCQPGLEDTYGVEVSEFRAYDYPSGPLMKAALQKGEVVLALMLTSDGTLG